jgi:O-antigen/teichoic acid export membrane protein
VLSEKEPLHSEHQQHERLLELSRRLRAVVRELGHHARQERGGEAPAPDGRTGDGRTQDPLPPLGQARAAVLGGDFPLEQPADEAPRAVSRADDDSPEAAGQDGTQVARSLAGSHSSRILLNAGFRAIADIGSKIATAALYIFVARKLGASQFGIYMFALSFVGVVTAIGFFGQDLVLAREVSRDHSRLEEYYSDAMVARSLFSVLPLLLVLLVTWAGGMSHHTLLVALLLGIGVTADYCVQVPFAVFMAYERAEFVAVVLIAQRWLTTGTAIAALYMGVGLVGVVGIYAVGSVFAVVLGTAMMYRYLGRPRLRINLQGALRVTREALPIGIAFVALTILFRIDMTMLAIFKPAREVGQYGAAYKLLETTAFFGWAVNVAVLPALARLSPSTSPTVGFVYQRGLKLLIAITLPVAVGAVVLATPIVSLVYGSQYHRASVALALLAATIWLFPVASLSSQLFFTQGRRSTVAIVYALVAVENIALNLWLIPAFSLRGAAAGTSISELLVAGALIFLAGDLRGRLQLRRMLAGPVLATAAAGVLMFVLRHKLAAAVPVGILAYLLTLFSYERVAFPDDFSVARTAVDQIRARFARAPAPERSILS